ncbi:MAG: hypothetical protein PHV02_21070 [Rhodocyclaceae bacterium]|nr:hypothetical protein [Rhodocyclaceae bacterium]
MQTAADYLRLTATAVQLLFEGIESYISILRVATGVTFLTSEPYGPKQDAEFEDWKQTNAERLAAARAAEQSFLAEVFALDTLCGAVLQVAGKALEIYGQNSEVPQGLPSSIKSKHAKYCIGRRVRTVPLGLVIYAARNQHTHFNDDALREPSASILRLLATARGYGGNQEFADPAFDVNNPYLTSLSSNITSLVGWRSYEDYAADMHALLGT